MRIINGQEMMSPSDIEKELHIKRSTLREYEEKNLIKPSARTEYGTMKKLWYDDATIFKLQEICMYRELGISLADIKTLFDDPNITRLGMLDDLIDKLEARKDELEKQIEFCKLAKVVGPTMMAPVSSLDGGIAKYINQLQPLFAKRKAFKEMVESGNVPDAEVHYSKLTTALRRIKSMRTLPLGTNETRDCLAEIIEYFTWEQCQIQGIEETNSTFLNCLMSYIIILGLLGAGEIYEIVEQECGHGSADFIAETLFYNAACEIDEATTELRLILKACSSVDERKAICLGAHRSFCEVWKKYTSCDYTPSDDEAVDLLMELLDFDDGDLKDPQEIKEAFREFANEINVLTRQRK